MSYQSNTRNPNRPLEAVQPRPSSIIQPARNPQTLFPGWGPKLFGLALAVGAINLAHGYAMAAEGGQAAACAVPDLPAAAVSSPIPEYPALASIEHANGTAIVVVHLAADGDLQSASIAESSGNVALDREALRVTRHARFAAQVANCKSIDGDYLYEVEFDA